MIDSGIPETTDTRSKSQFANMGPEWSWVQTEAARASVAGAPTPVSEHMVISENISEEFKAVMRAIDSTVNVGWIGKS